MLNIDSSSSDNSVSNKPIKDDISEGQESSEEEQEIQDYRRNGI